MKQKRKEKVKRRKKKEEKDKEPPIVTFKSKGKEKYIDRRRV